MRFKFLLLFIVVVSLSNTSLLAQEILEPKVKILTSKYYNKILKESDLEQVFADTHTDIMLQFERLTSYLFHQLINEYRISKKQKPLKWDDRLWLAARNHNIYLANSSRNEFGHDQKDANNQYTTGLSSNNRLNFVFGKRTNHVTGENVLQSFIQYRSYATNYAEHCLNMWQNSPPHNDNMLNSRYQVEATSIYIDVKSMRIYATTVFSKNDIDGCKPINISWNPELEQIYKNYKGEKSELHYGNQLRLGKN